MEGGFDRLGRIPGVELGPGVESPLGVGVLDFSPGVPALSRCNKDADTGERVNEVVSSSGSTGVCDNTTFNSLYHRQFFGLERG